MDFLKEIKHIATLINDLSLIIMAALKPVIVMNNREND